MNLQCPHCRTFLAIAEARDVRECPNCGGQLPAPPPVPVDQVFARLSGDAPSPPPPSLPRGEAASTNAPRVHEANRRGVAATRQGDCELAITCFNEALALMPDAL